jgi:2-keto-3-deoxy-L-rhamnonate aldolase RhmA
MAKTFRERVRARQPLIGVFVKTPSHHVIELLGLSRLDFAIVDAEHAPFDSSALDRMALAARVAGLPLLLRPPNLASDLIAMALDLGFAGIVAPHAGSQAAGDALLGAVRFDRGRRGVSPSVRAAGYGAEAAGEYRERSDRETSAWRQIEDAADLDRLDPIASAEAFDCLFIGRADLAASLGVEGPAHPRVMEAVRAIAAAGQAAGRAVGIFVSSSAEIPPLRKLGISVFACGSDQSWLLAAGRRLRAEFDA